MKKNKTKINVGVWIDLKKAIIVTLNGDKKEVKSVLSEIETRERIPGESKKFVRFGNQFSNLEKQKENRLTNKTNAFLKSILKQLRHGDALVVFGPASMKQELANLILENKKLVHKLKGVETADSMTTNQTAAWVENYYNQLKLN